MKGLSLWVALIAILAAVSCNKKTTPASTPPATNNTTSMTTNEQWFVGDWIVKRMAAINQAQDTVINFTNYNNPMQCHLQLKSSVWNNTAGTYESIDGLGCSPYTSNWKYVDSTHLLLGPAQYTIKYRVTDSMIIQYNSGRYYLKK